MGRHGPQGYFCIHVTNIGGTEKRYDGMGSGLEIQLKNTILFLSHTPKFLTNKS